MRRDSQRARVYFAEAHLRDLFDTAERTGNPQVFLDGISLVLPPEAKFACLGSVQTYCDSVLALVGERRPVTVRERKGQGIAHYQCSEIAVPMHGTRWALRELVLLHELAHHLTGTGVGHGPEFVAALQDLLTRVMSPQVGLAYRVLCAHAGASEMAL